MLLAMFLAAVPPAVPLAVGLVGVVGKMAREMTGEMLAVTTVDPGKPRYPMYLLRAMHDSSYLEHPPPPSSLLLTPRFSSPCDC